MQVQPYLSFNGRAEEALEFYKSALAAEVVTFHRFSDATDPSVKTMTPEGMENKVMHMAFKVGETLLNGSDGQCTGTPEFRGMSLALTAADASEADRIFAALSDGGSVQMPMTEIFFSPRFGMVADRFGVSWMVMAERVTA
jgi:PhnB protein